MPSIAVVYNPRLAKNRFGQQGFCYEKSSALSTPPIGDTAAAGTPSIAVFPNPIETLVINKGTTFVDKAVWEKVEAMPGHQKAMIASMKAEGSLKVFIPDVKDPVGSTSDYKSVEVIQEIVEGLSDEGWLTRAMGRDSREDVFKIISQRLEDIKEDKQQRAQSDSAAFV